MLAGRWHDAGKAHKIFQDAIKEESRVKDSIDRTDLAKAPAGANLGPRSN